MFEKNKEAEFLEKHFKKYYLEHKVNISNVENREFGYGVFGRKIVNRNISFSSIEEMNQFLRERNPLFFSYSNACYRFPDRRPMVNKELMCADIIYEFDADDLSEVKEINGFQWFSTENIEDTKKQVFKLINFLEDDFGFLTENISINFSGKAGYHIHLREKEIQQLGKQARIELVDYLTGTGIYFDNLGYDVENLVCKKGIGKWKQRIDIGLKEFFEKDKKEIQEITELSSAKLSQLLKSKEELLKTINRGYLFPVGARTNKQFWTRVLEKIVEEKKCPIDRQTSVDMHKIIRVPETLHGTTGFVAKTIKLDELKKFNPHKEAIVFGDETISIFIKKAPKFSLNGETFGPFEEQKIELPLYAGIYLLGKGAKLEK